MSADTTPQSETKKRKRRLLATLVRFRRRLLKACKQFHSAEKTTEGWFGEINKYLGPILELYPDLIPGGAVLCHGSIPLLAGLEAT